MLQWFVLQGADSTIVCSNSNLLLHFYLFDGFNKPSVHLITPLWNGGGPNK